MNMFLNIKANNFICFYRTISNNDINIVNNEFNINLLSIDEITIKESTVNTNRNNKVLKFRYQIEFDKFVDEGILNYFTLFFKNNNDEEFKRITKHIKINI